MRNKQEFKAYVYDKVNAKRLLKKRARAVWVRGLAAFSLLFVISGALIYADFFDNSKDHTAEASLYSNKEAGAVLCYSKSSSLEDSVEVQAVAENVNGYVAFDSFQADQLNYKLESEIITDKGNEIFQDKLIEIAKEKCTIDYDATEVSFDNDLNAWKVVFYTQNTAGGSQTVYLNSDGTFHSLEYGE